MQSHAECRRLRVFQDLRLKTSIGLRLYKPQKYQCTGPTRDLCLRFSRQINALRHSFLGLSFIWPGLSNHSLYTARLRVHKISISRCWSTMWSLWSEVGGVGFTSHYYVKKHRRPNKCLFAYLKMVAVGGKFNVTVVDQVNQYT